MNNYFQKDIECAKRQDLDKIQNERLVNQVHHAYKNVSYYQKKMDKAGVSPDEIKSKADLYKLPLLTKDDLRNTYPDGFFAVPRKDCVRIQSTSGTTGKRVIAGYTKHDLDLWEDCCARALAACGAGPQDACQIAFGYGLFSGGVGIHGGSHKLGCLTLPMSTGNTDRQIQFMIDMKSTVLCCTPSYAAYLAESLEDAGLINKINLKFGIFGGEPSTPEMIHDIEKRLNIFAFDIYGLTELSGPGVAFECSDKNGLHINEDHFIPEIIDPDTHEVLPFGQKGELVFSSIDKQAFPLLRYRTKDICVLTNDACSCGRSFVKMTKPMGRSDDMLIVKGVNVFPSQIETVLMKNGCTSNSQIVINRVNNVDSLKVLVEMPGDIFTGKLSEITSLETKLVKEIHTMLGIKVKVRIVDPRTLARTDGKAIKVIDERNL